MKAKDYYYMLYDKGSYLVFYYDILKECELNNKVDSLEYKNALNNIEKLKKEEDKICDKISNEFDDIDELCEFCAQISGLAVSETNCDILADKSNITEPINLIFGNEIEEEVLICMRISTRMLDLLKMKAINTELSNMDEEERIDKEVMYKSFYAFEPKVDKQFLDLLDEHIKEAQNYEDIRRMYIDAKYSYAFVRFKECDIELDNEEDEYEMINVNSYTAISKVVDYILRMAKLNEKTIKSKKNQRRVLLESDYLRALIIQLNDNEYDAVLRTINGDNSSVLLDNTFGLKVIKNILNFREEDLEKYNDGNIELKRKF